MLNAINDPIVDEAIKDPGKIYDTPEEVVQDKHLNKKEKKIILESWERDQIALLNAENENMPEEPIHGRHGNPAALIQDIVEAKKHLGLI